MINLLNINSIYQSRAPRKQAYSTPTFTSSMVSNFVSKYKNTGDTFVPSKRVQKVEPQEASSIKYNNNLKSMFNNNEVIMKAIAIRTFSAKDKDGDELIDEKNEKTGTFLSAINQLDDVKSYGINTLHLLPLHPTGKAESMGNAGSLYAPLNLLDIDSNLDDANNSMNVKQEMKKFVDEAHKRGIKVMIDLPSCVSVDFYRKPENKKYMAISRTGAPQVPQGWNDIRMFKPFINKDNRKLNTDLLDLHKKYVDMCVELGVDGIRADVARAKPPEFWDELFAYTKVKDPQFAWLAETYTYEDASPMINMPKDRPKELLNAGFDSYYGQFHIFDQWLNGNDLHKYIRENINLSKGLAPGKSLIGSFGTHDDVSLMYHGGTRYTNLVSGIMLTLPMTNPYLIDGYLSGDKYDYNYGEKFRVNPDTASTKEEIGDLPVFDAHKGKLDIFNTSRKPGGEHPEIGEFFKTAVKARNNYNEVITKGSYIPLEVKGNKGSKNIISYARHKNGKTLLVVANRNMNDRRTGTIEIPGLKASQQLKNLVGKYGDNSLFQPSNHSLKVDLAPGSFYLFEIDTPLIQQQAREVLQQNL